jgi:hypothetical protein
MEEPQIQVPETPQPCPSGWQEHNVKLNGGNFKVCHRDQGEKDGIYQEKTESLSLQFGDEFISSDDPRFKKFYDKLFLPNFSGRNLKLWSKDHEFLFPQGASSGGEEDYRDVLDYCTRNGLDFEEVKKIAANLQPASAKLGKGWDGLKPQEKVYGLCMVALLKGLAKEKGPFYLAHHDYVDRVLSIIEKGKLKFQEVPSRVTPLGYNSDTTMGYRPSWNGMQVSDKINLGLQNVRQQALLIHELFHVFQDSLATPLPLEEAESSAYQIQSEFIIARVRKGKGISPREAVDIFLEDNTDIIPILQIALHLEQARLEGNASQVEKLRKALYESINIEYYLLPLTLKLMPPAITVARAEVEIAKANFSGPMNQEGIMEILKALMTSKKELRDKMLQEVKEKNSTLSPPLRQEEINASFAPLVGESLIYILHKRAFEAQGQDFIGFCPVITRDKELNEMLRTFAVLRPLGYYYEEENGVD